MAIGDKVSIRPLTDEEASVMLTKEQAVNLYEVALQPMQSTAWKIVHAKDQQDLDAHWATFRDRLTLLYTMLPSEREGLRALEEDGWKRYCKRCEYLDGIRAERRRKGLGY
jgi:hypothetical protein